MNIIVYSKIGYDLIAYSEETAKTLKRWVHERFLTTNPIQVQLGKVEYSVSYTGEEYSKREIFSTDGLPLGYECWTIID